MTVKTEVGSESRLIIVTGVSATRPNSLKATSYKSS